MYKIKTHQVINVSYFNQTNDYSDIMSTTKKKQYQIEQIEQNKNHIIKISHNWFLKIMTVVYLLETLDLKQQITNFIDKIKKTQLKICSCIPQTIPKFLIEKYNKEFLAQILCDSYSLFKDIIDSDYSKKVKQQKIIKILQEEPYIQFLFNLLIRAITIQYSKKILYSHSIDYLGNQSDVLKDYSCTPQYKVINLIASAFKYNIQITHNNEAQTINQLYMQEYSPINILILKHNDSIEFTFDNKQRDQKKHNVQTTTAKDMLKNFFDQSGGKQKQIDKSGSRICVKCGQIRKQNEKFCICRKHKVYSNTTIPNKQE